MLITNLTNTRWYFNETLISCGLGEPEGWGVVPGYYQLFNITFTSANQDFISLEYNIFDEPTVMGDSLLQYRNSEDNYVNAWTKGFDSDYWEDEAYRTITITGGDDVTNPDLITWLEANATQLDVEDPGSTPDEEDTDGSTGHYLLFSSPQEFTFESIEDVCNFWSDPSDPNYAFTVNSGFWWDGTMEYSVDGVAWENWDGTTVLSSTNGKLYLRGTGNTHLTTRAVEPGPSGDSSAFYFRITGEQVSCTGNIETLLDYQTVARGEHPEATGECFCEMFWNCTALISAPDILMDIIPEMGCCEMFMGCTNLVKAPRITATKLESDACWSMFSGCTSLNQLPELCVTDLTWGRGHYETMFDGCSNIKMSTERTDEYKYEYRIPSNGTTTLGEAVSIDDVANDMFSNTGGTFTGTPELHTTYYTSNEIVRAFPPVEEESTKPSATFDLSTLNLPAGEYTIYVKLSAEGYKDSEPSNEVIYKVAAELPLKYPRIAMEANTMHVYEPSTEVDKVAVYVDGELVDTVDSMITVSITNVGPWNLITGNTLEGIGLIDGATREYIDLSDIAPGDTWTGNVHMNSEFIPHNVTVENVSGDYSLSQFGNQGGYETYVFHGDGAVEVTSYDEWTFPGGNE